MMQLAGLNRKANVGDGILVRRNCRTKAEMARSRRGRTPEDHPSAFDHATGRYPYKDDGSPWSMTTTTTTTTNWPEKGNQPVVPVNAKGVHRQKALSRPVKRNSDNICRDGASSPEDCRAPKAKSRTSHARKLGTIQPSPKTPPQGWVPSLEALGRPADAHEIRVHEEEDFTRKDTISQDEAMTPREDAIQQPLEIPVPTSNANQNHHDSRMLMQPPTTSRLRPPSYYREAVDITLDEDSDSAAPQPLTEDTLQKATIGGIVRSKRGSSRSTCTTRSSGSSRGSECRFSVATSRTALSDLEDFPTDAEVPSRPLSSTIPRAENWHQIVLQPTAEMARPRSEILVCHPTRPLIPASEHFQEANDGPNPAHPLRRQEPFTRSPVDDNGSETLASVDRSSGMLGRGRSRSQDPEFGIRRAGSDKAGHRPRGNGGFPIRTAGVKRSASDKAGYVLPVRDAAPTPAPASAPSTVGNETCGREGRPRSQLLSLPEPSIRRSASDRTDYQRGLPHLYVDTRAKRSSSEKCQTNPRRKDDRSRYSLPNLSVPQLCQDSDRSPSEPVAGLNGRDGGSRHSLPNLPTPFHANEASGPPDQMRNFDTVSEPSTDKVGRAMHEGRGPGECTLQAFRREGFGSIHLNLALEPQFYYSSVNNRMAAASPGLDSIAESSTSEQTTEPNRLRRKQGNRRLRRSPKTQGPSGLAAGSSSSAMSLSLSSPANSPPSSHQAPSIDDISLSDMDMSFLSGGESADCDFFSMADSCGPPRLKADDPFLPLVGLAAKELLRQYHEWKVREAKGTKAASGGGGGAARGVSRKQPTTPSRKRTVSNEESPISEEEGDGLATKAAKKAKTIPLTRRLACPFWKKDPDNHYQCYKKTLSKIKYVKSHLYKCHKAPIHCFSCGREFDDENGQADHMRRRECQNEDFEPYEGLSRAQMDQISTRADPRLDEQDQWFKLWDIIFPGYPRPLSAYIDNELSEDICNFREFLEAEGAHNLQYYLREMDPAYQRDDESAARERIVFGRVLDALYNEWLARRRLRTHGHLHTHNRTPSDTSNSVAVRTPASTTSPSNPSNPRDGNTSSTSLVSDPQPNDPNDPNDHNDHNDPSCPSHDVHKEDPSHPSPSDIRSASMYNPLLSQVNLPLDLGHEYDFESMQRFYPGTPAGNGSIY